LQIEIVLSVLDPALMLAEGAGKAAMAYNRVQNNGEMLLLGQALMMLQSGSPRHYFTGEKRVSKPLTSGVTKMLRYSSEDCKHIEVTRLNAEELYIKQ
jgi:hypothetical protein